MSTRRPRLPSAPPLTADDEARIRRQMSQAQYEDIQRRLEAYTFYYSQALQLAALLGPTRRQDIETELQQHPYVQGLFTFGKLESVLEQLEEHYQHWIQNAEGVLSDDGQPPPEGWVEAELGEVARRARRFHFIIKLVNAMGPGIADYKPAYHTEREQHERQRVLKELMTNTHTKLTALLADDLFCETLVDEEHLMTLRRLCAGLDYASGWDWPDVSMASPIKRCEKKLAETPTTRTRHLGYRLAIACLRHFYVCTPDILQQLLAYPWLEQLSLKQLQALITLADKQEKHLRQRSMRPARRPVGLLLQPDPIFRPKFS